MRVLYVACLIFLVTPLCAQDSVWIEKDLEAFETANPMDTYEEALDYMIAYFKSRKEAGPVTKELAENYRQTANWFKAIGNYQEAYHYIDTAIQLQREIPNLPLIDQAKVEFSYGNILYGQNLLGPSEYWYDKALISINGSIDAGEITARNIDRLQYSTSRSSLVAAQNLNFAKADLLNENFTNLFNQYSGQINNTTAKLNLLENIISQGLNLQKQERFAAARNAYEAAFTPFFVTLENQYSPKGANWNITNIFQNLKILRGNYANTYIEAGDFAIAEPLVRELLQEMLNLESNNPQFQDRTLITYGYLLNALQGQGKYTEMPAIYADAVDLRYRIDSTDKGRNLGLINTFMAEAANKQGDYTKAAAYFAKARYNFVGDATPIGPAQLPRIQGNLIYGQEEFLYFLQAYREAFVRKADAGNDQALDHALATAHSIDSLLQRGVAELSLTASIGGFLRLENKHYQRGVDLALRLYRERGEQRYLTKAFGFASVQKASLLRRYLGAQDLASNFGVPQAVIGKKIRLETSVLVLEQALANSPAEDRYPLRQQLLKEQQALTEIRRELNRDYPNFSKAMQGSSLENPFSAAERLEANQQVVEYFLGQDSIYLFTLTAASGLTHTVVPRPGNLEDLIANALINTEASEQLYQLLVAPVVRQSSNIKRLQFIPDGILWNVPFAALRTQGEYLIQQQAVSYAYASSLLFATTNADANNKSDYLGYGISYDEVIARINASDNRSITDNQLRDMGSLPYARREVEEVAALLNAFPILGAEVTKEHFFQRAPSAEILHLAMHGILKANPMESALVFQSQGAGAYDLLEMRELLGRQFPAKLTVLSACHSGNGPLEVAEGRQSIGRAFAAAGSRAIITSNWAAPDRATYTILKNTIEQVNSKQPTDLALQQGVLYYLAESSLAESDPKNWAHLSLTGNVAPVYPQNGWKWALLTASCLILLYGVVRWKGMFFSKT